MSNGDRFFYTTIVTVAVCSLAVIAGLEIAKWMM